jgi:uncharacterized Fe-S cluster protein YjdI
MQEYRADAIIIRYDPKICIHAAECVGGLPVVFDVNKRPWVNANAATPDEIKRVIELCPSGALSYEVSSE